MSLVDCGCGKQYDDSTHSGRCPHDAPLPAPSLHNATVILGELRASKDIKAGDVISIDNHESLEEHIQSEVSRRLDEAVTLNAKERLQQILNLVMPDSPELNAKLQAALKNAPDGSVVAIPLGNGTEPKPDPVASIASASLPTTPTPAAPDAVVASSEPLEFHPPK